MKRSTLKLLLAVLSVILAAELAWLGVLYATEEDSAPVLSTEPVLTEPSSEPTEPSTQPTETTGATETTEPPTEPTTEPTEPPQSSFILTFTGDCTLGSQPSIFGAEGGFIHTIGTDYGFPFRNMVEYFENDDLTLINLESVLANEGYAADKLFVFRGPTDYINILTGSSVEAVTLANNHTYDFGQAGYDTTKQTLEAGGVTYVEKNGSAIFVTEGGLVVGLYGASFERNDADMRNEIASLRNRGAQIIVAAVHWGNEGQYRATQEQKNWAHAMIDAGIDIVWGNHPHVLQPIEEYKDGIIFYSLGNFSFGGNTWPRDLDSAVLQQEVILEENGTVRLGELKIIPCSVSSMPAQNNFQPTPYPEGSAQYDRVMSKLDGSFTGPDLVVNYEPTQPSEPEESTPGEGGETPPPEGGEGGSDTGGSETPPPASGGDTGGDTGGNTGGDTGGSAGGDAGGGEAPPPDPGTGET